VLQTEEQFGGKVSHLSNKVMGIHEKKRCGGSTVPSVRRVEKNKDGERSITHDTE
jgi:hypothetical protein